MDDAIRRIQGIFPAGFFRDTQEAMDAGFAEAWTSAVRLSEEPERANLLGQLRHTRCETGFRAVANNHGLSVLTPHTEPAGGRYSLVHAGGVFLIRSNIQRHTGTPRATSFRKRWAELNEWLEPQQLDWLQEVKAPDPERLCCMLVTTSHPRRGDPTVPAYVGLGIPNADLSAWVRLIALADLLALYAPTSVRDTPIDLKDIAIPKLKKRPDAD